MIAKGKARSGPGQLAAYLLRTTNGERPTVLYLEYGNDDLKMALIEWDSIGELTNGKHTLYHAQISPEAKYEMTPAQWGQAAAILVEELGMKGHPYAVILHAGGDKPHIHVVIMRTDMETMTLWDDSFNYVKHERASQRMEITFNHAPVPGKHGKRNREAQPEFPRSQLNHSQGQEEKRTGLKIEDRKAEITGLHAGAADGPAFKAALEEAGYRLARGDRGYVVVDRAGGHSVLSRNIEGFKKKDVDRFMAGIALDTLPTIKEAQQLQKNRTIEPEPEPPAPPPPSSPAPEFSPDRHRQAREAYEAAKAEATGGGQHAHQIEAPPPLDAAGQRQREQETRQMHAEAFAQARKEVIERVLPELAKSRHEPGLFVRIHAALHEIYDRTIEHVRELSALFTGNRETALATPKPPPPKKRVVLSFKPPDPDRSR